MQLAEILSRGDNWLDIGSNWGPGLSVLTTKFSGEIFAVDLNPESVQKSASVNPRIKAQVMDARCLGFQNESFSIVTAFEVIEHLGEEDQVKMVAEIQRVLKPGGYLFLSTPNAIASGRRKMSPDHITEMNKDRLVGLLEGQKLTILDILGQGFFTPGNFLHQIFRQARQNTLIRFVYNRILPWDLRKRMRDSFQTSQELTSIRKPAERETERLLYVVCQKQSPLNGN